MGDQVEGWVVVEEELGLVAASAVFLPLLDLVLQRGQRP